jgi:hypothetical protein
MLLVDVYDERKLTPEPFQAVSLTQTPLTPRAATGLQLTRMFCLECTTRRPYEGCMALRLVLRYKYI